ncbi:MAG: dTDP-4-dehydrorhamnose reductase [Candidatus Saccharibacteria bacterium]|nr:dTDP-4-dehydrorhamnose reductase [Candidatus Saccharibacteria bacterium]
MKILITGARGMLAQAVREKFAQDKNNEIILTDLSGRKVEGEEVQSNGNTEVDSLFLDITDPEVIKNVFNEVRPELVINCAAYTAVDKAEIQEELAYKINAEGPGNLARACAEIDATLVHVSTDYVFGGKKPVSEDYAEDDEKSPETAYGKTKLAGEEQIVKSGCKYYIFRTAWLYGEGNNFVRTMLKVSEGREEVSVVNDQHGSPTYTEDLTDIIYQAVTKHIPYGIYNATDLGYTTWAEFTEKIYELAGVDCKVVGISSAEYEAQAKAKAGDDYKVAKRPFNSKMSKQKLLDTGVEVPTWEDGLKRYLEAENNKKGNYEE